jgi:hypothetical protein
MNKKAQSAIEFMIVVIGAMFFMFLLIISLQSETADKMKEQKNIAIKEVADTIVDEINLAHSSSDGYYREFVVSGNVLNGAEYNIYSAGDIIYVSTTDNSSSLAVPVANYTGSIKIGTNLIRKVNGSVYVN